MSDIFAGEMAPIDATSPLSFDPAAIFYDATSGRYLVDVGTHFRSYTRKSPVITGAARFYTNQGIDAKDAMGEAKLRVADAEIDRAVDWSGAIAGHRRGIMHKCGLSLLVTTEPELPEPLAGPFPTISGIIRQAFPDSDPRMIFTGWLAGGIRAARVGIHQASPMMVLAGQVNSGKSLIAWITAQILGGRVGHPFTAWSGTLPWNDDLVGAELLLIDDSVGTTDIRKRKEFGARFKEAVYGAEVQVNRRHASAMSLRPVWRVMVCCNDTPEALGIIPPIDDDLADKVALLRVNKIAMPIDTSTPAGKLELQRMVLAELPAFAAWLDSLKVPDHLVDSRSGVMAWRDPELEQALGNIAEESRFEELLGIALDRGSFGISPGESVMLTAADVEAVLCGSESPVRDQSRNLLSRHHSITGRLLGKLARGESEMVCEGTMSRGNRRWEIVRPLR